MNRFIRRRRIFDSQVAAEIASGYEVLGLSDRAAIFETRRDRAVAAAIDADAAGVVEGVRLGLDVQHASRAQAVLRRQRAGQQCQAADDAGVEDLPEGADAVGQHDAVDAILKIGVLVAHMQFAACGRILRDAGHLQQHLVQRRIVALRQRLDGLVADLIRVGADRARRCCAAPRRISSFLPATACASVCGGAAGVSRRCARDHARLGTARRLRAPRRHDLDLRKRCDAVFRGCGVRRLRQCAGCASACSSVERGCCAAAARH